MFCFWLHIAFAIYHDLLMRERVSYIFVTYLFRPSCALMSTYQVHLNAILHTKAIVLTMSHDLSACVSYTITYKVRVSLKDSYSKNVICMNRTVWATPPCCYSTFEFFSCALRSASLNLLGQIKEVKPRLFLCQ